MLLDKIHHNINIHNFSYPETKKRITLFLITNWLTKAAAILLIPVLTFLFYTLSDHSFKSAKYSDMVVDSLEIIAPAGSRTIAQLSDGTEVYLNNGSRIKYPRNFNGKTRELTLSGEGYFNVAHNPKKPFIVKTRRLNIKALGTKFNVLAYPDNDQIATTLVEGKVVLEKSDGSGKVRTIGALLPGQHVDYNVNTDNFSISEGNVETYTAWKDGLLVFDNTGINDVAERLERMFNVDIEVADEIKDYTYTVKLIDESLLQILDLLNRATPVKYKILPREKLPDGTYSKQKILLRKK